MDSLFKNITNVVAIQKSSKLKNKFSTDEFKNYYLGDLKDLSDNKLFKT